MNDPSHKAPLQSEQEYQKWLRTFYKGSFLVKGWDSIKHDLCVRAGVHHSGIAELLDDLGDLIGREWAKDNHVRKIHSCDLQRWGHSLKHLKRKPVHEISSTLHDIREEVIERLKS